MTFLESLAISFLGGAFALFSAFALYYYSEKRKRKYELEQQVRTLIVYSRLLLEYLEFEHTSVSLVPISEVTTHVSSITDNKIYEDLFCYTLRTYLRWRTGNIGLQDDIPENLYITKKNIAELIKDAEVSLLKK